jgi:hypothetical protein
MFLSTGNNFEYNYGLGKEQHLSEVFVMLLMIAFLIDQTQQLTFALFKAAWQKGYRNSRSIQANGSQT